MHTFVGLVEVRVGAPDHSGPDKTMLVKAGQSVQVDRPGGNGTLVATQESLFQGDLPKQQAMPANIPPVTPYPGGRRGRRAGWLLAV